MASKNRGDQSKAERKQEEIETSRFFNSVSDKARRERIKFDLSGNEPKIIEPNRPMIPGLEDYLSEFEHNREFIHIIDIISLCDEFLLIVERVQKAQEDKELLFSKLLSEHFPRIPTEYHGNLYPYVEDRNYRGFSIYNNFRVAEDKIYTKRDKEFINFGKVRYETLMRNIIILNYFKFVHNRDNDHAKLEDLQFHWSKFAEYYGLAPLPTVKNLRKDMARFFKLLK